MRSKVLVVVCVAMLAGSSPGVINVRIAADKAVLAPGETTRIRILVQATAAGLASLGGNVTADGPAELLVANDNSFAWAAAFSSSPPIVAAPGSPGAGGGWSGFGSQQTNFLTPDLTYAKADYVEVASYAVTAQRGSGSVSLSFAGTDVGGFKSLEWNMASALGTLTAVSITVGDASTEVLVGDVDRDGSVSILDLLQLVVAYGTSQGQTGFSSACDLDHDGAVGVTDLLILLSNFGKTK